MQGITVFMIGNNRNHVSEEGERAIRIVQGDKGRVCYDGCIIVIAPISSVGGELGPLGVSTSPVVVSAGP